MKIQTFYRSGKGISAYYAIITLNKQKYDLELTAILDEAENHNYVEAACGRGLPANVKNNTQHKAYMQSLLESLLSKYTQEQIMSVAERQLTDDEQYARGFVFKANAEPRPAGTPFTMPTKPEVVDVVLPTTIESTKPQSKSDRIVAFLKEGKTGSEITKILKAEGLSCYSSEIYNAKKKL